MEPAASGLTPASADGAATSMRSSSDSDSFVMGHRPISLMIFVTSAFSNTYRKEKGGV